MVTSGPKSTGNLSMPITDIDRREFWLEAFMAALHHQKPKKAKRSADKALAILSEDSNSPLERFTADEIQAQIDAVREVRRRREKEALPKIEQQVLPQPLSTHH